MRFNMNAVRKNCKLLVICGPSGSGKSSLISSLLEEFPERFGFSVSHTTRSPRPKEIDGVDYYFTSKEKMENEIKEGKFLETAVFCGNMYGTSLESVEKVCSSGKVCVLDIEIEGVKQVKEKGLDLILVYIKPPSVQELETRLKRRASESDESLNLRVARAKDELQSQQIESLFDTTIVNGNLKESYKGFKDFVIKELARRGIDL